ncbi:MAG: FtsX-like permease family protein [Pseudolysinimonas sp.]
MTEGRLSDGRLLLRHLRSSIGPSVLVAVIVLAVTLLAALAPRGVAVLTTAELRHEVGELATPLRDPVATAVGGIPDLPGAVTAGLTPETAAHYGGFDAALASITDNLDPRLAAALGQADYYSRSDIVQVPAAVPDRDAPITQLRVAFDPRIQSRIRIVDGVFPTQWVPSGREIADFPVLLSVESAATLRWTVGERRVTERGIPIVLSGTFEAITVDAEYWLHAPSVLAAQYLDDGNSTPQATGIGYANPLSVGLFGSSATRTTVWYPMDGSRLDFADATALAPDLRSFTATAYSLPEPAAASPQSLRFQSRMVAVLEDVLARASTTVSLLAMVGSGPLGVVLAVLGLGARSIVERRRRLIELASARGASARQLRSVAAGEGALLGVIPAALAILAATLLLPARVGPEALVAPVLLGLAPAVLFALAVSPRTLRGTRPDIGVGGSGPFRWIAEVLVIGLAAVAVLLLVRRGLATSAPSVGVDPLLAATPLLLAVAACVVVLRVYPIPLAILAKRLHARPGLTGFLGATRSVRDRSLALTAVFVLVVGVSVSVFSGVMLTTLDRGIAAGATSSVGADLRAQGPVFDGGIVSAAAGLPGVRATSAVDIADRGDLRIDDDVTAITLYVADTRTLAAFRPDLPLGLGGQVGDAVPIVLSSDLAASITPGATVELNGATVAVAQSADRTTGYGESSAWAIVDSTFARQLTGVDYLPTILLVDTTPQADATALAASLASLGGPTTTVTSLAAVIDTARAIPTAAGLRIALIVAIVASALLALLTVVMSSAIGAPSRTRLLAVLHTLGASARQAGSLVVWELAPLTVVAIVAGTLLGLAVPWVVLAGVDLRPFTKTQDQPPVAIDPVLVFGVLGVLVLVVLLAGAISVGLARRRSPAGTLRMGAEE